MHVSRRNVDAESLNRLLRAEEQASLTYSEVGATRGPLPSGYDHGRISGQAGNGRETFERLSEALRTWRLHQATGFLVHPAASSATQDQTVLLSVPFGPLLVTASARVVYAVDERDAYGFAYGTLPLHPETGEEYFGVHIDRDDRVFFETVAFSRPRALLARAAGPVGPIMQRAVHRRYLMLMKHL